MSYQYSLKSISIFFPPPFKKVEPNRLTFFYPSLRKVEVEVEVEVLNKKNVKRFGSTFLKGREKKIEILFKEYW